MDELSAAAPVAGVLSAFIGAEELIAKGVLTAKTLARYSESGYLKMLQGVDGENYYRRTDLAKLFGISTDTLVGVDKIPTRRLEEGHEPSHFSNSDSIEPSSNDSAIAGVEDESPILLESEGVTKESANHRISQRGELAQGELEAQVIAQEASPERSIHSEAAPNAMQLTQFIQENARLAQLVNMHQETIKERSQRVSELLDERAWLRERVEKLEEQLARTQVLMLSGNQTIQELVTRRERRSPLQRALGWFGLGSEEQHRSQGAQQLENFNLADNGADEVSNVRPMPNRSSDSKSGLGSRKTRRDRAAGHDLDLASDASDLANVDDVANS